MSDRTPITTFLGAMRSMMPSDLRVGDVITDVGEIEFVSTTAYLIRWPNRTTTWLPFYGPHGAHKPAPATPLVVLG